MTYRISLHRSAKKFLASAPDKVAQRISDAIDQLTNDPRPHGCLKLADYDPPSWRIRIGDYRILYQIMDNELLVWVFKIDRRGEGTY